MTRVWRGTAALLSAATVALAVACASAPPPRHPGLAGPGDRPPLILVPGLTGVRLVEKESGRIVWGRGRDLFCPRDHGHALALPLGGGPARLRPGRVIRRIRLAGVIRRPIYEPVVRLLEANGYLPGELERPERGGDLFLFAYDWRQGNQRSAAWLAERLEALRRARGTERLEVDLLCQSNGALICRYFARYGGASLEAAAAGIASPGAVRARRVILVGSSNGGALRTLRELDRGRRYVPWVGRRFDPETLFTFPALFQDLPVYRSDLFLDPTGEPREVDLFDPASWEVYGWSAFAPEARRRLPRRGAGSVLGGEADRRRHLARALEEARTLHQLLRRGDPGRLARRYHSIQSLHHPTPERAVLEPGPGGAWRLHFPGDPFIRERPRLAALATVPGDGHATGASQLWLHPAERQRLAEPDHFEGEHFGLILEPETHRRLLEILAD